MQSGAGMNLVSLMDIFTILVFFLLANTGAQQLPSRKDVKLPVSVATKPPGENLVVTVTRDSILVQGTKVAPLQEVLAAEEPIISALSAELQRRAPHAEPAAGQPDADRAVIIMGDESIPYGLLRKILVTCQDARFNRIEFAAHLSGKDKI
jgi:biopolymer transport protein ExbD